MTDSTITTDLREIASDLREAARRTHGDSYSIHSDEAEEMASKINRIVERLTLSPDAGFHEEANVLLRRHYGPAGEEALRTNAEAKAIHDVASAALADMLQKAAQPLVLDEKKLKWHLPENLRWLAQQNDRPGRMPTGDLTGSFLTFCADRFEEMVKREQEPAAGTSAYQMVADAAQAQVETTETLIHMVAATVLMNTLGMANAGADVSVSFSPRDMDEMHRRYEMTAKHDGLLTTVSIKPRPDEIAPPRPPAEANLEAKPESLMMQDEPEAPAKGQAAPHVYDRPLWSVRRNGKLVPCSDQEEADRKVRAAGPETIISIENRFCYHEDCPASGCRYADRPDY